MTDTPILAAPHTAVDPLPIVWDPNSRVGEMLQGRRGLVIGVANADSIAYGCAVKLRAFGADIALTYLNDKAKQYVAPQDELIDMAVQRSPGQRLVDIAEIGRVVGFLAGPGSSGMTGDVVYIDAGLHNMA